MPDVVIEIDGKEISTLEEFCERIWPLLSNTPSKGTTNLDALNDILSWPASAYVLIWKNSELSKQRLGYGQMAKKLSALCETSHPSNGSDLAKRLQRARNCDGPTMFDWLVDIIRENEPYVTLKLA